MFWKVMAILDAAMFVVGIIVMGSGISLSVMLGGSWQGAVLLLLGMVICISSLLLGMYNLWKIQEKESS